MEELPIILSIFFYLKWSNPYEIAMFDINHRLYLERLFLKVEIYKMDLLMKNGWLDLLCFLKVFMDEVIESQFDSPNLFKTSGTRQWMGG